MCASLRPRTCSLMLNRLRDTAFRRLLLDPILEIDTRSTLFTAPVGLLSLIIGSLGAGVAVRDNGNGVSSVTLALVVFLGGVRDGVVGLVVGSLLGGLFCCHSRDIKYFRGSSETILIIE